MPKQVALVCNTTHILCLYVAALVTARVPKGLTLPHADAHPTGPVSRFFQTHSLSFLVGMVYMHRDKLVSSSWAVCTRLR